MTGTMGRGGQIGRLPVSGLAALAAGSLIAALGLSACGSDPARADTVLRDPRAATVVLADGTTRAATAGMTVPKGATVRTEPGGSAALVAAGRSVLLGAGTAVTVVDGARERLDSGLVLVDARHAPGVAIDAGSATVSAGSGSLARVERGALLRAVAYRHDLHVRPTGRRSDVAVDALHQVQVPDGGLPGAETPIALTRGDTWERSYVLDLVTADADLTKVAAGLDGNPASSAAVLSAVPASYLASAPAAAGEKPSETALAFVIADAAKKPAEFAQVRQGREQGGSWGVVAAIFNADLAAVSAALDTVLNPTEGPAVLAAANGPVPGTTTRTAAPAPGAGPGTTPSTSPASAGSTPGKRPSPRPSASPSPASDPVSQVVTTVTGLLPTPTPVAVPLAPLASPSPLVSLTVGGLGVSVG
jgi:hypothetical protein